MRYTTQPDNDKFRKTFTRDVLMLLAIAAATSMGIVFTLYYSMKYNW